MKKPLYVLRIKLKGEIYSRVYSIKDIKHLITVFNEINQDGMKINIDEVIEEKS